MHSRLHEPLILMHSVRGKQQRERSRSGFRKGRIDNSPNMRLSKPKSQLTTQERGGNAPSIARGFGRKCCPVLDSERQACIGMTFQKGDRRWRPVAATCLAMCERTSPMFLIVVVARLLCGTCPVSPHWVTDSPLVLGTITVKD